VAEGAVLDGQAQGVHLSVAGRELCPTLWHRMVGLRFACLTTFCSRLCLLAC
jgi:hypothetical protein